MRLAEAGEVRNEEQRLDVGAVRNGVPLNVERAQENIERHHKVKYECARTNWVYKRSPNEVRRTVKLDCTELVTVAYAERWKLI